MKNYFKQNREKEPWQIAAARYCVTNSEKGFTTKDLESYIRSQYKEISDLHLNQFFEEEIRQPTGRNHSRSWSVVNEINKWTPPLDLVSKITDYDELKEARKNSRQAFWLSMIAIVIALITLIVTIYQK